MDIHLYEVEERSYRTGYGAVFDLIKALQGYASSEMEKIKDHITKAGIEFGQREGIYVMQLKSLTAAKAPSLLAPESFNLARLVPDTVSRTITMFIRSHPGIYIDPKPLYDIGERFKVPR